MILEEELPMTVKYGDDMAAAESRAAGEADSRETRKLAAQVAAALPHQRQVERCHLGLVIVPGRLALVERRRE